MTYLIVDFLDPFEKLVNKSFAQNSREIYSRLELNCLQVTFSRGENEMLFSFQANKC